MASKAERIYQAADKAARKIGATPSECIATAETFDARASEAAKRGLHADAEEYRIKAEVWRRLTA